MFAIVLTKQYDSENQSKYSVQGLSASDGKSMTIQHLTQKNKINRHLVDMSWSYPVPGSTSGQTYTDRVYLVVQRSPFTADADIKGHIATFLAQVGGVPFQTAVLNKEL